MKNSGIFHLLGAFVFVLFVACGKESEPETVAQKDYRDGWLGEYTYVSKNEYWVWSETTTVYDTGALTILRDGDSSVNIFFSETDSLLCKVSKDGLMTRTPSYTYGFQGGFVDGDSLTFIHGMHSQAGGWQKTFYCKKII